MRSNEVRIESVDAENVEQFDTAPPAIELMALNLGGSSAPTLSGNWAPRAEAFGSGLTAVYTGQCPYITGSVQAVHNAAKQLGVKSRAVQLKSSHEVRERSPSAY